MGYKFSKIKQTQILKRLFQGIKVSMLHEGHKVQETYIGIGQLSDRSQQTIKKYAR